MVEVTLSVLETLTLLLLLIVSTNEGRHHFTKYIRRSASNHAVRVPYFNTQDSMEELTRRNKARV